jgi:hypothetical protein
MKHYLAVPEKNVVCPAFPLLLLIHPKNNAEKHKPYKFAHIYYPLG